jgi:CysZ protein
VKTESRDIEMGDELAPPEPRQLAPIAGGLLARCPRCGSRVLGETAPCPQCRMPPLSAAAVAKVAPTTTIPLELLRGALYPLRALATIARRPWIWHLLALPLALNIIFSLGVAWIAVPQVANWLAYITAPNALHDWTGFLAPLRLALVFLGWSVRGFSFLLVPAITAWVLSSPPFRVIFAVTATIISERVEREVLWLGRGDRFDEVRLGRSAIAAIVSSLGLMALELGLVLVLVPIALIPFAGTFVWLVAPRALVAGLDQLDPILVRKLYYPREKAALVWRHRWRCLGFGGALLVLLGAPWVNAFVFPLAPVAATLLYVELEAK